MYSQVKIWFQNKRAHLRKKQKELLKKERKKSKPFTNTTYDPPEQQRVPEMHQNMAPEEEMYQPEQAMASQFGYCPEMDKRYSYYQNYYQSNPNSATQLDLNTYHNSAVEVPDFPDIRYQNYLSNGSSSSVPESDSTWITTGQQREAWPMQWSTL